MNRVDPLGLDDYFVTVTERLDRTIYINDGGGMFGLIYNQLFGLRQPQTLLPLDPPGGEPQSPQNPGQPIPPGDLAQNVANLLTGDCGTFVNSLYERVAGMNPDQPAHSPTFNLLDVFNTINGRQGGVVFQPVVVGGRPAGGTVSGSIGNTQYPATIYISPIINYAVVTPVGRRFAEYSYAMTAVHETFHLAGRNGGYGDERMARAVHALTGAPGLPKNGADVYEWSGYWNNVLRSKCPERR